MYTVMPERCLEFWQKVLVVLVSSSKDSVETPKLFQQRVTFNHDPAFVEIPLVTYLPFQMPSSSI